MRKVLIFIIILGLVIGGAWFFYKKSQTGSSPEIIPTIKSLFFSDESSVGDSGGSGFQLGNIFNGNQDTPPSQNNQEIRSQFKRLTSYPVAGFVVYDMTTTKTLPVDPKTPKAKPVVETTTKKVVRYVSRRNGYVYEIDGNASPLQITNISVPNIYEAIFTNSNNNVLLRFLRDDDKTIATYNVPIPKENPNGTRTQIGGSFLPDNIASIDTSSDGSKIAYLIPNTSGSTTTISDFANLKKSTFLDSTFKEWLVSWPTDKKIFLQTRASYSAPGFLYYMDIVEKKMRKVLGGISGLTTSVSPSGNYVLYSEGLQNGIRTRIFNTKDNSDTNLNLAILPEKCAWLKNENVICAGSDSLEGLYPDSWYQGTTSLSDKIYFISPADSSVRILYDGTSEKLDMINLQVEEVSRFVYFINKPTGELWRFNY